MPRPGFLHGNRFDFQTASFRTRLRDLAAHAREFYPERPALRDQRAQGMPGARCARSLVCKVESTRVVTPESPGIPRAMVLTVSFVPGDRACSPPSSANSRPRHPSAPKVSAGLKCRSAEDLAKAESVARLRAGASRLTSVRSRDALLRHLISKQQCSILYPILAVVEMENHKRKATYPWAKQSDALTRISSGLIRSRPKSA